MWKTIKSKRRRRHQEDQQGQRDIVCDRCQRPMQPPGEGWNVVLDQGYATGYLCPDCQTPEENAAAETHDATHDYTTGHTDAEGRVRFAAKGAWHSVSAGTHGAIRKNQALHMVIHLEPPELQVAVGPQSDARLNEMFNTETCTEAVREALEREGARPGTRTIAYLVDRDMDSRDVWIVEDHAMAVDGTDSNLLLVVLPPDLDPHLLTAFAPEVADSMREAIGSA